MLHASTLFRSGCGVACRGWDDLAARCVEIAAPVDGETLRVVPGAHGGLRRVKPANPRRHLAT